MGEPAASSTTGRFGTRRMTGRDPHEANRAASPLELLFDLTFVIAFGVAAEQLSELVAAGQTAAGLLGFAFATFAVCWAWINFSWFASAYDTDDWAYRLLTMLQMVGVLILSLGIPPVFASIAAGGHIDNRVMVGGYIVMRVALSLQWVRAATQAPQRRAAALAYPAVIATAQLGWLGLLIADPPVTVGLALAAALAAVEMAGPWWVEHRFGRTPWHAHHIAERYALLTIIALGEGVVGAVASLSALVAAHGWTVDAALIALAGTAATFGMWWLYFTLPFAQLLHDHRERAFSFGYLHIAVFGSILATGAGLRVAAALIAGHTGLSPAAVVLAVATPVTGYLVALALSQATVAHSIDGRYLALVVLAALIAAGAVASAARGVSVPACLLLVAAAPAVVVAGLELGRQRR